MLQKKSSLIAACLLGLVLSRPLIAQNKTVADIKGYVKAANSGEALPSANVILKGTKRGTITNTDGFFTLVNVPVGVCSLSVHYIGYYAKTVVVENKAGGAPALTITLAPSLIEVGGVTVTANVPIIETTDQVGQITLSPRQLASLPNFGEVDLFRTLQLLPGVSGVSDGSSGLYVRGGTPDQNLVLFDGMTIYHVDHFFGFFSAFNADAIKDIQMYKGGFPAQYGGRLSSVVDLTGKTGDQYKRQFGFGANLLSGHVAVETPVFNKGTFLLATRRSYTDFIHSALYDKLYGFLTGDDNNGSTGNQVRPGQGRFGNNVVSGQVTPDFYFYDLNSKLTLPMTNKDILTFSFYNGKDNLDKSQDFGNLPFAQAGSNVSGSLQTSDITRWGNLGFSGKWSRQWHARFHMDALIARSRYFSTYDRNTSLNAQAPVTSDSSRVFRGFGVASEEDNEITDLSYKLDFNWQPAASHRFDFGLNVSQFRADYRSTLNDSITLLQLDSKAALYSWYAQDKWQLGNLALTLGVRGSQSENLDEHYLEPRASFAFQLSDRIKLLGAWGEYRQFVNRITNENVLTGSRDFWLLADAQRPPGFSEHRIAGVNYETDRYLFSVEAYDKGLENLLEYSRRVRNNADADNHFYVGTGTAKGIEFLAQKKAGALSGWLGYTLGKVEYHFPSLNNGNPFPADQDRRHEIKAVAKLTRGVWAFAATWTYATGRAYTAPESQYFVRLLNGDEFSYIHVGEKNANRLPVYHRLDLSASRRFDTGAFTTEAGVSLFNAYNHKNIWYREYNLDTTPVTVTDALMLGFTPTLYVQFNLK